MVEVSLSHGYACIRAGGYRLLANETLEPMVDVWGEQVLGHKICSVRWYYINAAFRFKGIVGAPTYTKVWDNWLYEDGEL